MEFLRLHRKVWLWWGPWWAMQIVSNEWFNLGLHAEPRRPLVDVFLGPLTLSLGRHPVLTDPRERYRHRNRGFLQWAPGDPGEEAPL